MNQLGKTENHSFLSKMREFITINGVTDVASFDERTVILQTTCGSMAIEGEDLHITVLNIVDGIVEVAGKLSGLYYFENSTPSKRGLFGKARG